MNAMNFTEKDYLQEMLNIEKTIVKSYGEFITEASCPTLRGILSKNFGEAENAQLNVYNAMSDKGYYKVKPAPAADISEAKTAADAFQREMSRLTV
ncbi:MAG: spore coat protein [Clostridiales bacterium]|jgi:spore coat protein CotF|nr:spore coat protein [Clostridiales bacterium]